MADKELLEKILSELTSVRDEVGSMKTELTSVKNQVELIRTQQEEDHSILKALRHSAQINRAEHDKMFNDIAYIQGHVKNIDESLSAVKEISGEHEIDIRILKNRIK